MFKSIANFLLARLSSPVIVELIKAQLPKLSDAQKQELLNVAKELLAAAAAGAVQGAANSGK